MEDKIKIKKFSVFAIISLVIYGLVLVFYIKSSSGYYDNTVHLQELDSFAIEVRVFTMDHAVLLFNGRNSINTMNLNYHKINGHGFDWGDLRAPFIISKDINNDTVTLTKRGRDYLFILEK